MQNRSKCLHNGAHLLSVITLFLIKISNLHFSFIPLILTPTNSGIYGNNGKFTTKQHISLENMENLQRKVYKMRLSVHWGGRDHKFKSCHSDQNSVEIARFLHYFLFPQNGIVYFRGVSQALRFCEKVCYSRKNERKKHRKRTFSMLFGLSDKT